MQTQSDPCDRVYEQQVRLVSIALWIMYGKDGADSLRECVRLAGRARPPQVSSSGVQCSYTLDLRHE